MLDWFYIGDSGGAGGSVSLASIDGSGENLKSMSDATTNAPPPVSGVQLDEGLPSLRLAGTTAGPVTEEESGLLEVRAKLVKTLAANQQDAIGIRAKLERAGRCDAIRTVTGHDAFDRSSRVAIELLGKIDVRLVEIDVRRNAGRIDVDADVETLIQRP
ncbi:MAG: hypothetical protein QMB94_10960 [Phycisphaerales bacterium]